MPEAFFAIVFEGVLRGLSKSPPYACNIGYNKRCLVYGHMEIFYKAEGVLSDININDKG
jgi:hypothetical protein